MTKNETNVKHYLIALFSLFLVLSNIMATRIIATKFIFLGSNITLPGGILLYPLTFLITDVIGEKYGKKEANRCVLVGLVCQISTLILQNIIFLFPVVDSAVDDAYKVVFDHNIYFVIGSLVSYFFSQLWDVFVFHRIRNHMMRNGDKDRRQRWLWNNVSTITSQLLDTIIFSIISFGIGFRWLQSAESMRMLVGICIGQYIFKVAIAILDTPVFYLLTKRSFDDISSNN